MVQQLNLSSRPFRNRTLPWILSAAMLAVSFVAGLFVFVEYNKVSSQISGVQAETAQINPKIAELTKKSEQIRQSLAPEQQALLRSAHQLVDRKRFSWSRLFADIESVLPGDVMVSNIVVRDVYRSNERMSAELDFAAQSRDYNSIVKMINEMNASGIFAAELRGQDLQRDKGNLTEYTMRVIYNPRAGTAIEEPAQTTARVVEPN